MLRGTTCRRAGTLECNLAGALAVALALWNAIRQARLRTLLQTSKPTLKHYRKCQYWPERALVLALVLALVRALVLALVRALVQAKE